MNAARILVVEDDRVVARHLEQQLLRMGYAVVGKTASGEEACEITLRLRPDLVLMDIRLEGPLDGIDAAERMNRQACIPVVFLTAYADDETIRRARLTEPFGYLLKPFEESQLRTVVEMALYKHAADRRLRESERRFAATLSSICDAVIATDVQGAITYLNPVAEQLTGWSAEQAQGRPLREVFVAINEDTRLPVDTIAGNMLLVGLDGSERLVDASDSPIIDDRSVVSGAVVVFRDLTRQREVDKALRRAQVELERVSKATTIGELTASIAHEINQPLAAIAANASAGLNWLRRESPDLGETLKVLERVKSDATRAADVIRSLQALARKARPVHAEVDLHAMILEVCTLTRADMRRHSVRLTTDLAAADPHVLADSVQIQQVLLNLVANAIDAMGANGDQPRVLTLSTSRSADRVRVRVADTGSGVAAADRESVFEPFFSTKAEGMGMGLAICRSVIEAHAGRLWNAPAKPVGTEFVFELPSGVPPRSP
jgi:PAS domain S-box-containing protein